MVLSHDRPKDHAIPADAPHPFLIKIGFQTEEGRLRAGMAVSCRRVMRSRGVRVPQEPAHGMGGNGVRADAYDGPRTEDGRRKGRMVGPWGAGGEGGGRPHGYR